MRTRRMTICVLTLSAAGALVGGCQTEGGAIWSDDRYVYVSRAWEPKTVTLTDTRTGEAIWTVDVPIGQQVIVGFSKGTGPNEYKPDEIVWEVMTAGRKSAARDNRMPCPPRDSRRLDMAIRPSPEMPGTAMPGTPFGEMSATGRSGLTRDIGPTGTESANPYLAPGVRKTAARGDWNYGR